MLPVIQKITDQMIEIAGETVERAGGSISCEPGCTACCYWPVAISATETAALTDKIESLSQDIRDRITSRFRAASDLLESEGWLAKMRSFPRLSREQQRAVVYEYFGLQIPCPFLENDLCSIYEDRPLACREYMVTSPPQNCSSPSEDNLEKVKMPFGAAEALRKLDDSSQEGDFHVLIDIFNVNRVQNNIERTGREWMTKFADQETWVEGEIKFSLRGQPVEMKMTVPAFPVKPSRMLPVFQQMTNSFVEIGIKEAEEAGKTVSCEKGCGACCRQAVPLAEIEAYRLAELVNEMPEPRRSVIRERFANAVKHFQEMGWLEKMQNYADLAEHERKMLVLEYFYENIPCPFLEDESCSIHPDRPVGCREYLVTSPAENCSKPSAETVRLVQIPLKPSETLRYVGHSRRIDQRLNFVPLVYALEWAAEWPDNSPEKPGPEWVGDFFSLLTGKKVD
jgi:Fe-S-cluster containining protein